MTNSYIITSTSSMDETKSTSNNEKPIFSIQEGTATFSIKSSELFQSSSSKESLDNQLNTKKLHKFRENFTNQLIQQIREHDFEYGLSTIAESIVKKAFKENSVVTRTWLNEIFIQNYHDEVILLGILRIVSHFDYLDIIPHGPTIALAALANKNPEVREGGIRAFENWATIESLQILQTTKCDEEWLNKYLEQVIADLREEFKIDVSLNS